MSKSTHKSQKSQKSKNSTTKTESQEKGAEVILDTQPKKKTYRSRAWFLTLNNPEQYGFNTFHEFMELFGGLKVKMYAGQLEKGHDKEVKTYKYDNWTGDEEPIIEIVKGTDHYQACIYFENQILWNTLVQLCPHVHWEVCKNFKKSIIYCTKEDTRMAGPWVYGITYEKKTDEKLKGWQLELVDILDANKPDRRSVYWIWERHGGRGKSLVSGWLEDHRSAMIVSGNCKDIAHILSKRMNNFPKIIIIDIPRINEDNHLSFSVIEQIKNGRLCSGKYDGVTLKFDIPHVVIFSNKEPDLRKLSKDRWRVYKIRKDKLLKRKIEISEESESESDSNYE